VKQGEQASTGQASLAAAIHDLHARLGSIRIAVTAVAGLELDIETRNEMLNSASDESVRASAELAAIAALTTCLLDDSEPAPCDVAVALSTAAQAARLVGIEVAGASNEPHAIAPARAARLDAVLLALIRLVGGTSRSVAASATIEGERLLVRLRRQGEAPDPEKLPPVAGYLVDQLGARHVAGVDGIEFSLAVAR
jgi:hypothetical protein